MDQKSLDALGKRLSSELKPPDAPLPRVIQTALLRLAVKELQDALPVPHRQSG